MQQGDIQERFDYLSGQICGLQVVCAKAIEHLVGGASSNDLQELRGVLQGIADHTVAIDVQGDLQGVSLDHRGPFYAGVRYSIEQITQRFMKNLDEQGQI